MVTRRRMSRSPSLRGFIIYEDRPREPPLRRDGDSKTPDQVLATRGTFNRPPSSPRASATVTITTRGANRASLKLLSDTNCVAAPREPARFRGVGETKFLSPSSGRDDQCVYLGRVREAAS